VDAVLICTPEYAFGVPGTLKNALDWTVSSGELVNKPLALITASTGGDKAHAAFLQIFTALSAKIPEDGALLIPFIRSKINAAGEISDAATLDAIQRVMDALILSTSK
jgi:chromate reductase